MTVRNTVKQLLLAPFAAVFRGARRQAAGVALTFDDGPHPDFTPRVSTILKEHGARATFFFVGERIVAHPGIVAQVLDDGHEVSSHSMTHPEMATLPPDRLPAEIGHTYDLTLPDGRPAIANRFLRPPKGVVTWSLIRYCRTRGLRMIFWNRDPEDYCATSAGDIVGRVGANRLANGDIVLLHDKTPHIVEALPAILQALSARSLRAVTVSELLAGKGDGRA